jgi:hypothetical protein
MNLQCPDCGRQTYSASPEIVVRNGALCECGGTIVQVEEDDLRHKDDAEGDSALNGP